MNTTNQTNWTKSGTQILKNGAPVFLKGVCYSPTPCGAATYTPGVGDWFTPPWNAIWKRDFALMKAAGIDNIRTYFFWAWTPPNDMTTWKSVTSSPVTFDHKAFLDDAHKNGISVTIGIALDGGNIFDNHVPSLGEDYLNFYAKTAEKLAELYGNHPAVMGFCIGNEQNNPARIQTTAFWDGLATIAAKVRQKAPNKLVMLAMQNDNPGMFTATITGTKLNVPQRFAQIFDVWGLNIYAGMDNTLANYNSYIVANTDTALPCIVSEWGTPGGNKKGELTPAEFQTAISTVINPNTATMNSNLQFVAGAQYFEWTDEWWKGDGGATPWIHSLPKSNAWPEEWWGLNSIAPNGRTAKDGPYNTKAGAPYPPDTLTARPTLAALTTAYSTINVGAVKATLVARTKTKSTIKPKTKPKKI